jgi:hypothetical protein
MLLRSRNRVKKTIGRTFLGKMMAALVKGDGYEEGRVVAKKHLKSGAGEITQA